MNPYPSLHSRRNITDIKQRFLKSKTISTEKSANNSTLYSPYQAQESESYILILQRDLIQAKLRLQSYSQQESKEKTLKTQINILEGQTKHLEAQLEKHHSLLFQSTRALELSEINHLVFLDCLKCFYDTKYDL